MNNAEKWDKLSRIYDQELMLLNPNQLKDVQFWKKKCQQYQVKTILEIGCGSGRLTVPLLEEGYEVTGLDFSKEMLKKCKSKIDKIDNFTPIQADMRNYDLKKQFDLILFGYFAFQQLVSLEDQWQCLDCTKKHLKENGVIGFDLYPCVCEGDDKKEMECLYSMKLENNTSVKMYSSYNIDRLHLIKTWYDRYIFTKNGYSEIFENEISLRECSPDFFQLLTEFKDLQIIEKYGSFEEGEINKNSQNCLYLVKMKY